MAAAAAAAWPDFAPARFEPDDPAMRDYLEEHGFVAIKAAASEQEEASTADAKGAPAGQDKGKALKSD